MTGGPRAFAVAVLLAVALLPRTGWVVRDQLELLSGGWGPFGTDMGIKEPFGLIPQAIFRSRLDDPVAQILATVEGTAHDDRPILERAALLLDDPKTRGRIRASVIRQAFVGLHESAFKGDRRARSLASAQRLLLLIEEGERAHPGDTFYPASAWSVMSLLGRDREAADALARAARGDRYDDGSVAEGDLVARAVEMQHGYRGQTVRLVAQTSVLFPQYAPMMAATDRFAAPASLADPRRRDVLRLAGVIAASAPQKIGVIVAGSLVFRAVGSPVPNDDRRLYPERFARFAARNRDFELAPYQRLFERTRNPGWPDVDAFRRALAYPAMSIGAGLFLATLLALLVGLPHRAEPDETPRGRLSRVPWAWLATAPGLLRPDIEVGPYGLAIYPLALTALGLLWGVRSVRPGTAILGLAMLSTFAAGFSQALWWTALPLAAAIFWLPARFRPVALLAVVASLVVQTTHSATLVGGQGGFEGVVALCAAGVAGLWLALPVRRGLAWPAAVCAGLYVLATAFVLRTDVQQGAVVREFREEGARFRAERGF